jgi:prolyl 4-hydroxylase
MHLNEKENHGGGPALQSIIFTETKRVLEDWTGQELSPVSLYGVRLYHNGSILAPHVDRLPLVISAISELKNRIT